MNCMWYHGTIKEKVDKILKEGFKQGTYFTPFLDSAIGYGGDYVFFVLFDKPPFELSEKNWQWRNPEVIEKDNIIRLVCFNVKELVYNPKVDKRLSQLFIEEDNILENTNFKVCDTCNGEGQLEYYPYGYRWRDIKTVTTCKKCKGKGKI